MAAQYFWRSERTVQHVGKVLESAWALLTSFSGVLATDISRRFPTAYMFRTYDCEPKAGDHNLTRMPLNPGPASSLQIWQVARATSAAPLLFPSVLAEDQVFRDGGMIANNPSEQALRDVAFLHKDDLTGTCLVSMGSGILRDQHARPLQNKRSYIQNWKQTIHMLREIATQTEATHRNVYETSSDHSISYFRFNPELDREIFPDDWLKQHDIEQSTILYLQTPAIEEQLRQCASAVVSCKFRLNFGTECKYKNVFHFTIQSGLTRCKW
jgi:hypothetical protein